MTRVDAQSRDKEADDEGSKEHLAHTGGPPATTSAGLAQIIGTLRAFQKDVSEVVNDHDGAPDAQVACQVRGTNKQKRDKVVDDHLHRVRTRNFGPCQLVEVP